MADTTRQIGVSTHAGVEMTRQGSGLGDTGSDLLKSP